MPRPAPREQQIFSALRETSSTDADRANKIFGIIKRDPLPLKTFFQKTVCRESGISEQEREILCSAILLYVEYIGSFPLGHTSAPKYGLRIESDRPVQTASWAVIALRNSEKQEQQIKAAQIILAGAEKLIAPVAPNTPITTDTLNLKLAMSLYLAVTNNTPPEEQYYYLGIHNFRRVAETMLQQSRTDFATTMVELSHGCDNNPAALELATEYLQRAVHHIITGNPETALGIIPQLRDRNQAMRHERTSFRTPPSDSIDLQLSALEMLATAVVQHRQAASRTPR